MFFWFWFWYGFFMENEMGLIGHNKQTVTVNSLSVTDKEKLKNSVSELNDSMTRVSAEKDLQKEIVDDLHEKLGLEKKLIRRLAKTYFKANFNEEMEETKNFEDFYALLLTK